MSEIMRSGEHPAPDDLSDELLAGIVAAAIQTGSTLLTRDTIVRWYGEVRRRRDQETALRAHVEKLRGNVSMKCGCLRDQFDELMNGHAPSCLHTEWAAVLRILDGET